jgi:drug/metabolite transporter (DMT)-like permease
MFTIFTPFYVILLDSFFAKKFRTFAWIAVLCTVLGSAVISYSSNFEIVGENIRSRDFLLGFWLLQISNLCFAIGQFFYAKMFLRSDDKIFPSETTKKINHTKIFALLYLGGSIITFIVASFSTSIIDSFCILSKAQIFSLLYLGIIASGLGFFLWNVGATKVGTTLLAIFNNLKIPLAVLAALIFLPEKINFIRFVVGSALIIISLLLSVKSDKIARR